MQIIPIIEREDRPAISARRLYEFLELRPADYARWIDKNITGNALAFENEDWNQVRTYAENPSNGRPTEDYELSIPFAKKLAMMSRSKKGEIAREYFLECEKRLLEKELAQPALPDLSQPLQMALLLQDYVGKYIESEQGRIAATEKLALQAPQVNFAEAVMQADDTMNIGAFAKSIGWGPNTMFAELRARKILYYRDGKNLPYQEYLDRGYFKVAQVPKDGRLFPMTTITPKGMIWLTELLGARNLA